jgi:hypothetical protein
MRRLLLLFALIITLIFLGWQLIHFSTLSTDDFVEYWSAGHLNIIGDNPYSSENLFKLQHQAGSTSDEAIMMWNPPWTLTLIMPFSIMNYHIERIIWLLCQISILLVSTRLIWYLYEKTAGKLWIAFAITLTFVPFYFVLRMGQISAIILVGIVAFLYFQNTHKDWLAGSLIMLAAVKPQLLHLIWLALLLWAIDRRQWHILGAGALTLIIATIIPLIFNHHVINQYLVAVNQHPPKQWAVPTIGAILRLIFGVQKFWLQFIPALLSGIWFIFYWRLHRTNWSWIEQIPILILVSMATTTYGWEYDHVILLLPILVIFGNLSLSSAGKDLGATMIIMSYALINVLQLMMHLLRWESIWGFWIAPAWLIWYLLARIYLNRPAFATTRTAAG